MIANERSPRGILRQLHSDELPADLASVCLHAYQPQSPAPMPIFHQCRVTATTWAGVHVVESRSDRSFPRHWHADFGIGIIDTGGQASSSGRGAVCAYPGQIITTNPGEVHDGRPMAGEPRSWRMLYVTPEAMHELLEPGAGALPEIAEPVIDDVRIRERLGQLFNAVAATLVGATDVSVSTAEQFQLDERLALAIGELLHRHAARRPVTQASRPIHLARELLADSHAQPPSLGELAAQVGLSRFHLVRRFAQAFGMSPYAWLLLRRAESARHLVATGRPLAEAAARSGFADQSHMTRTFVRNFGYTPGAWR